MYPFIGALTQAAMTLKGVVTVIHVFSGSTGGEGLAGVLVASDDNLYGTTDRGGTHNRGTVFRLTPSGTTTCLICWCPNWTAGCRWRHLRFSAHAGALLGQARSRPTSISARVSGVCYIAGVDFYVLMPRQRLNAA